jgi:TonB family protein
LLPAALLASAFLVPLSAFQETVYDPGDGVTAPVLTTKTDAEYSDSAQKARYQGAVILSVVVDARGEPRDVEVVRKLGLGLDEEAVEAVKQWRFAPGTKDGQPAAVRTRVQFTFRLPDGYGKGEQL